MILAFRRYTRGIISYNYFVTLDEESRHRFRGNEKQRVEHILQVEDTANDAMIYLSESLETMPDFGQHPNEFLHRKSHKSGRPADESSDDLSHMFSMNLKRHESSSDLDRGEFER